MSDATMNPDPEAWLLSFQQTYPERFGIYGRAMLEHPHLLKISSLPEIVGHAEGVVEHFRDDGLSREDYLDVVADEPRLLLHKSSQVVQRIETVLQRYGADRIARMAYIRALVDHPHLFRTEPLGVIAAIDVVMARAALSSEADRRVGAFARRIGQLWDRIVDPQRPTSALTDPVLCPMCRDLEAARG